MKLFSLYEDADYKDKCVICTLFGKRCYDTEPYIGGIHTLNTTLTTIPMSKQIVKIMKTRPKISVGNLITPKFAYLIDKNTMRISNWSVPLNVHKEQLVFFSPPSTNISKVAIKVHDWNTVEIIPPGVPAIIASSYSNEVLITVPCKVISVWNYVENTDEGLFKFVNNQTGEIIIVDSP